MCFLKYHPQSMLLHDTANSVEWDGPAPTVAVVLSILSSNTMERQSPSPDFLSTHGGPQLIGRHQPAWPLIGGERARVALQSDVTESSPGRDFRGEFWASNTTAYLLTFYATAVYKITRQAELPGWVEVAVQIRKWYIWSVGLMVVSSLSSL